ncbi:MAG TPA: flagellar basal-body MS-ring/collar protein FliF [Myxococcales bacterium]|nr:flagellar basal-body MS-ring/collar protein FliF [Myxococcales bacterium]
MESLLKPLRDLKKLPKGVLIALAVVVAGAIAAATLMQNGGDKFQYAFTNLTAEDSAEAAAVLKGAGVPFRLEAGGAALAVPESKVYDARLLLASSGLPRGSGVGFELFDRGDLGVSEFTQKVNLRRALEGELARTVGHLADVRSARVHLTLEEKSLYREDEHRAAAAVMLQLQPGRSLGAREIAGIRHLVASSVPGLEPEQVTLVDGRGTVLAADDGAGAGGALKQREIERGLEQRLVSLLEPAVGVGAVIARVSATLDDTEITTSREQFDPQGTVRSEHKVSQSQTQQAGGAGGVAGAAANQPEVVTAPLLATSTNSNGSQLQDDNRNYEVGKTVTRTIARGGRLSKLSIAILLDGENGKPRSDDDVARLGELARKAVGFDEQRGDQMEISSAVFSRSSEVVSAPAANAAPAVQKVPSWAYIAGGAVVLALLLGVALRGKRKGGGAQDLAMLKPGEKVATLEAMMAGAQLPQPGVRPPDPSISVRDRARELSTGDPARAAHLLKAWIAADEPTNG